MAEASTTFENLFDSLLKKGQSLWDLYSDYTLESRQLEYDFQIAQQKNNLLALGYGTQQLNGGNTPAQSWSNPNAPMFGMSGNTIGFIVIGLGAVAVMYFLFKD